MANINNRMAWQRLGCECGNTKEFVDAESGETVCPGCGVVMQEKMETRLPDTYNQEDRSKRSGHGSKTTILMHDMGLSTVISQGNRDASGKPLGNSMKTTVGKLRMWDARSQTSKPGRRGIKNGLMELNRLKDKMGSIRLHYREGGIHLQKGRREWACQGKVCHGDRGRLNVRRMPGDWRRNNTQ